MKKTTLATPPDVAEEKAMLSRANMVLTLVGLGFEPPIYTTPRIATPLWYEYYLLEEDADARLRRGEWPCLLLHQSNCHPAVWFCTISGDWLARTAKGRGIIALAEYALETNRFDAAERIFGILSREACHAE